MYQDLTPRQREILARLVAGDQRKQIANALDLSLPIVKHDIVDLYAKIGARNLADAVRWALTEGGISYDR